MKVELNKKEFFAVTGALLAMATDPKLQTEIDPKGLPDVKEANAKATMLVTLSGLQPADVFDLGNRILRQGRDAGFFGA